MSEIAKKNEPLINYGYSEWFVNIDRETPMLFPVDMRDGLSENHLTHFIVDAISQIEVSDFEVNKRGSGNEQFQPGMMLSLLIYSYVTGRFGSRTIEATTYTNVVLRYICADTVHPDHSMKGEDKYPLPLGSPTVKRQQTCLRIKNSLCY